MDFTVLLIHRRKLNENKKINKYMHLARGQKKKMWNMRALVIPVVCSL